MNILVVVEHDNSSMRMATRCAIGFARAVAAEAQIYLLVLGHGVSSVNCEAACYGRVLVADSETLAYPLADRYAPFIAQAARANDCDLVIAAATTFGKDITTRAAGLLGGAMASDVIGHECRDGQYLWKRPMHAGAVNAVVRLLGRPQIVTVRASAYEAAIPADVSHPIETLDCGADIDKATRKSEFVRASQRPSNRPDVTEARVVVSGGRALKNSDDFERLVGGLADSLEGATGSSRALVDAGITPNDFQVGQTGKIVAPELYVALGISGAVQHLAGMKNSKTIVAINRDRDAPIFEVADIGLVADVYDAVPQWIEKLRQHSSK